MQVFALTGGFGSGKSSVARHWRARGLPVVDADELARRAVARGEPVLEAIARAFGPEMLQADGTLDRRALAGRVFGDTLARERLNQLVHPRVRALAQAEFAKISATGAPLACYEVPLLFETGQQERYRPVVVVSLSEATQLERAMLRDGATLEQVRARIKSQLPLADKVARADYVIDNEGTLSATEAAADRVLSAVCRDLSVDPGAYAGS